ncbi:hypothetical protein MUN78_07535 [Leucobacter allii]|uniref:Ig-like domain-containing protein n=1 Tax=Leucobacter allii TaxID=2932247 RepID=A0ABY4FQW8_9MICO|nr:hypothetical protein [Leucobacter allii]UOQ58663.1 hypothetical protein MUN78_07535 [Leucobacter allii]
MRAHRTRGRTLLAAAVAVLIAAGGATAGTAVAFAEEGDASVAVDEASFLWGISGQYQGGNPGNSTCNYLSAGEQTDYAAEQGNARIVHDAGGGLTLASAETRCSGSSGTAYTQKMLLTGGTGTANPATGEAEISWDGAVVANAYGGLVPWSITELGLHVGADGTGTLSATLGGYGASMEHPDVMIPLEKTDVTLATFSDVTVTEHGIEVLPDYAGVEVEIPAGEGTPQDRTVAGWGSWPQSVVDFHIKSGLSSYWYSSGGAADPTKAATAFTVQFDGAPEVIDAAAPPTITEQPKVQSTSTVIINGRTVTVTAKAENATSYRWERTVTKSTLGAWETIPGADSETLSFEAAAEWNGKSVRLIATNASGSATSQRAIVLTADYQEAVFLEQPTRVIGFAGSPARFTAGATASPQLVQELNRVEISTDEGETWEEIAGTRGASNALSAFVIPELTLAQDGALIRAVAGSMEGREAGSPGQVVASDPVRLTVLPAKGAGPQLAVVADGPIDPAEDTTVTIVGAGYTVPAWTETRPTVTSAIDLALFTKDAWQPGTGGLTRVDGVTQSQDTWTDGNPTLTQNNLTRQLGTFAVTATIPAGTLDAGTAYGVGTYLRENDAADPTAPVNSWENRDADAWAPLVVLGQEPAEFAPVEADLTEANRGRVAVPETAEAGAEITVAVGEAHAGDVVQLFLFSDPVSLGAPEVAADGTVRVTLPDDVSGAHRIAAYTADGSLIGWGEIGISAPAGGSDADAAGSGAAADAGGAGADSGAEAGAATGSTTASGSSSAGGTAAANGSGATSTAGSGANGASGGPADAGSNGTVDAAARSGLAATGGAGAAGPLGAALLALLGGAAAILIARRAARRTAVPLAPASSETAPER